MKLHLLAFLTFSFLLIDRAARVVILNTTASDGGVLHFCDAIFADEQLLGDARTFSLALRTVISDMLVLLETVEVFHAFVEAIQAQTCFLTDFATLPAFYAFSWYKIVVDFAVVIFLLFLILILKTGILMFFEDVIMIIIKEQVYLMISST